MTQYLKWLWVIFYVGLDKIKFYFSKTFYLSPVIHPFSKATFVCLARFLSPAAHPFPRLAWQRLQGPCNLRSLGFLEAESTLYFGIGGHRFFPMVYTIMNFKPFDLMFDSKISINSLHIFVLFLFYMLEQRWLD